MTKQLTRQEVEAIVKKLETFDNTYCSDCNDICDVVCSSCNHSYDLILLGTVLEKMHINVPEFSVSVLRQNIEQLISLWRPLGLSRSLQEIIDESGYQTLMDSNDKKVHQELVSPEANQLFSFLQDTL